MINYGMEKNIGEMTVLVTGASRGIGAQIALRFASVGMNVIIHYMKSHEAANEVARKCMDLGARVMTVSADLRSKDQIAKMKDKLDSHGLRPDILVNNAGIAHYGLFSDVQEAGWDEVMDVNLKSVFLCTQIFMPHMISQRFGRIINVSSVWGITGASCEVIYSAAKGGVNAFSKALAKELAPSGVTVNAVAPGAVKTDMMADFDDEELRLIEEEIPVGRLGSPEEIASLVYFLALPESGYITGQVISPNGGWLT
ncbi:3-oxoacyl-[acyl-carrier protein] reductase [Fontibacillus panacisegetis]|uniref:3-oxoacyl-[acyl-carrier protein] reductase n=1 Tax=Fontibacillus panacisegetis TaxID=670482 RepID=A0A1G7EVX6_9BACL|nr:3-oxoacyl-ACP reductase FabG [Fontibacillus panacisegetis]SDE67799.1 3-oxoacyl-[acyl-carrier protein] reductase [Fontibacillus panacisegetis]